jgi:hypothetical protein
MMAYKRARGRGENGDRNRSDGTERALSNPDQDDGPAHAERHISHLSAKVGCRCHIGLDPYEIAGLRAPALRLVALRALPGAHLRVLPTGSLLQ